MQLVKPPPKRRRILDHSTIVPVPIYSNKVSSSFPKKVPKRKEKEPPDDGEDEPLGVQFSRQTRKASLFVDLCDSEDETESARSSSRTEKAAQTVCSPSPPPPESFIQKPSRRANPKIKELDRRLQELNSLMSSDRGSRRKPLPRLQDNKNIIMSFEDEDDDVIITSPDPAPSGSLYTAPIREIPLKIRCRADLHKIPVLSSTPLSTVVEQLSVKLQVPPSRLLLVRDEVELPTKATMAELGLGIADIIECVVLAAEKETQPEAAGDVIKLRLQSKDKESTQEFSLHKDAPLGSVFSQYVFGHKAAARKKKVCFQFDGCTVSPSQTPAELDMEDGDIIEVWA